MLIRKFVGKNERSMLRRIRAELGPDPVILHTAFIQPKGLLRFLHRPRVEIVAGSGFQVVKDYPRRKARPSSKAGTPAAARPASPAAARPPDEIRREIRELKEMVTEQQEMMRHDKLGGLPKEVAREYLALTSCEVSQLLARKLVRQIQQQLPPAVIRDRAAVRNAMREALRSVLRCADGIALQEGRCVRVAFIGPTGVGKTTTIAKLMSIYSYRRKEVAVITNDTYRIAATDQIKRVAEIVGVPIRVCRDTGEIRAAVREFSNRDLVLVDTAGRSQKNWNRIDELRRVLEAAEVDETHLVLSAATQRQTLLDVVKQFSRCQFSRIVFTKIDEAVKVGLILDVLSRVDKDLSFVTTGQEIPRDIEIADPARLASLILGEEAVA